MSERQPLAQLLGRLVRRAPVKRHESRRTAVLTNQLRAPPIGGDERHLDVVRAAIDHLVEALTSHDVFATGVIWEGSF